MTERRFVVPLSELHNKKRFVAMTGEKILDFCLFEIVYRKISGIQFYELRFPEKSKEMDICSNNAADIIAAANRYFEVVLVP